MRLAHVQLLILGLAGFSVAVLFGLDLHAAPGLALPILGIAALGVGGVLAAFAWARRLPRGAAGLSLWDIAGLLVLLGCAALIVGEPEDLLRFTGF